MKAAGNYCDCNNGEGIHKYSSFRYGEVSNFRIYWFARFRYRNRRFRYSTNHILYHWTLIERQKDPSKHSISLIPLDNTTFYQHFDEYVFTFFQREKNVLRSIYFSVLSQPYSQKITDYEYLIQKTSVVTEFLFCKSQSALKKSRYDE